MSTIDSTEARLNTHEIVCAERYKAIELRMGIIDERAGRLEEEVKEIKESTGKSLKEIKSLIEVGQHEKFKTMITATGTIIVSLIGMLGYLLTHLK